MLNQRLHSFLDPDVRSFLEELEQVTGLSVSGHSEFTLLGFLTLCQRDVWRDKKQRIDAAHFYSGSMLKTKVEKLSPSILRIVTELCRNFKVPMQMVETKTFYVFLNDILNAKSRIRKLPPIRL